MRSPHPNWLSRLVRFYWLSIFLATIAFTIQDLISREQISPFLINIQYFPIWGGRYLYTSFLVVLLSIWLMTHFIEQRPFVSIGLKATRFSLFYFCASSMVGIVFKTVLLYTIVYFQLGLLPKWPFFAAIPDPSQFLLGALPVLIGPVTEELFYRGYLLQTLSEGIGTFPAVIVTSIAFGLSHYYISGWMSVLNAGLLGILLCIVCLKTRSLWLPIGLHFGFNLIGGYWGIQGMPTPQFTGMRPEVLALGNYVYTIGVAIGILIILLLPLRPDSKMQILWDRYIHPAPWPPWRRRAPALAEDPTATPSQEIPEQASEEEGDVHPKDLP